MLYFAFETNENLALNGTFLVLKKVGSVEEFVNIVTQSSSFI